MAGINIKSSFSVKGSFQSGTVGIAVPLSYGSFDPAAGTGEMFTLAAGDYSMACSLETGCTVTLNLGETAFDRAESTALLSSGFRRVGTY